RGSRGQRPLALPICLPLALTLMTQALQAGQAALAAGDMAGAVRWLDRAARLAPGDPVVAMALGAACLTLEPGRAAGLFGSVPAQIRPREGWWGLVAARLALGDAAGAGEALAWALGRFVVPGAWAGLASAVVRAVGAAGWCGVGAGELVVVGVADPDAVLGRVDGRRVAVAGLTCAAGRRLDVRAAEGSLLGSPLRLDLIRRVEGCVAAEAGGLRGWAWRPGDPDAEPVVMLHAGVGRDLRVACTDPPPEGFAGGPLVRARGFSVPAAALAGGPRRGLRVRGGEGGDLLGSPFDLDLPDPDRPGLSRPVNRLPDRLPHRAGRLWVAPRTQMPRVQAPAAQAPVAQAPVAQALGVQAPRVRASGVQALGVQALGVVVPVHGQADAVGACLRAVLATVPAGTRVVVVDDASPEPGLRRDLRALATTGLIRLIRHRVPRGFPAAANAGMAACPGRDVVLLNSDTLPSPGWIERLQAVAGRAPDIGSVTPLSNNAGIVSYPGPAGATPMPDAAGGAWLADLAWRVHGARTVGIPVGVGFCLYVRRACWAEAGPFRARLFAQGYGEETDFCLRARARGWRHVAAPGVFVGHRSGLSFGVAAVALQIRNKMVLERLHPGYAAEVAAFLVADPLAPARRRLDQARWDAARRSGSLAPAVPVGAVPGLAAPGRMAPVGAMPVGAMPAGMMPAGMMPVGMMPVGTGSRTALRGGKAPERTAPVGAWAVGTGPVGTGPVGTWPDMAAVAERGCVEGSPGGALPARARSRAKPAPTVLLITHSDGGGVERVVVASCQAHRAAGRRAIVLRPGTGAGRGREVVLGAVSGGDTPNLSFALPREVPALLRLLRAERLVGIELHHLLGHPPAVADLVGALGVPYEVHVHDYAWICPRITLTRPDRGAGAGLSDTGRHGVDPRGVDPLGTDSLGTDPLHAAPLDPAPLGAGSLGAGSRSARPHGPDPVGGRSTGSDRYCGEPGLSGCEACIAVHGSLLDEPIGVRALRRRSVALLRGARSVVAASADAAARLRRYVPGLIPRIAPLGDDAALPPPVLPALALPLARPGGRLRVCVVGAIGPAKGVGVLLACATDAAARDLPLEFVVVGPTTEDAALLATGRVFVTGPFQPEEIPALIGTQGAGLALLPSIWPETWCFALADAWRAGLDVVAFDLGAPAERIRRTGRGTLLPLGLPPARINEMLLARAAIPVHL
ncbi:MAG: glycosyltransferase, partial [Acetobacteraceae bacterium]